ncbi:NAD(P)-binding protein [Xylaria arbuscula]|nr:NAD(P)-binding protein [Xylaria arbuscula]
MDANAYTTPFMLTKSIKRDVYDAIDPSKNTELQASGKVVLITGGGGGIGFATAKAWDAAGAKGIVLLGRTKSVLDKAVEDLKAKTKIIVVVADITVLSDVESAFKQVTDAFGHVDVVVNTSSTDSTGPIGGIAPAEWWKAFEVNIKGAFNVSHTFIASTGGKGTIVNLTTLSASFLFPGTSAYSISKLALIKLGEHLDAEHPDLRVFSVHPGVVEQQNGRGVLIEAFKPFAKDTPALTGSLTLWLSTPKADFLKGGYIHSNWDVEELEQHKTEITEKKLVKLGFINGQLQPGGYPWSS